MPDLFEQLSKESEALLRKPNRSREGHSLTTPFQQDLGSELEGRGFTVTSGYRPNDRGSRHASGAALDIRTKDKPTEVVDVLKSELEGRGYRVLDERYVKTPKQTGPHLHVSTDDPIRREMARQSESRKPQRDIFATLADESEAVLSKQPAKPQPATPGTGGDVVIRQPVTPSVPFPARPRNAFEQVVDEYTADKQAREAQAKKGVTVRDPYAFTVSKQAPSNLQPINKPPRLSVTPRGIQSEQPTSPIAQPQPNPARQPSTPLSRTAVTAVKAAVPALNAIPDAEIENVIGQIAAGATDTVTDVPVGLAVQAANATPLANQGLPEELRKKLRAAPIEGVKSAVQPVRDIVSEQLPVDPNAEGFFNRTLPRAVGSAVPYIGTGIATRGASPLASAMLGTTGAAAQGYEDAQRSGADVDLAVASGAVNSLTGLLESVGMGRWLNSVGGKQALTKRALEVLEEGGQEGLQEWASNVNAAVVSGYDPERPLSQGVLESTLAGLLIGAGAQSAGLVNANAPNVPIAPESASRPIPQAADAIPPQQNISTQIISNESPMQARRAAEQLPPATAPASPQTAAPSANDDFFGGLQSKLGRVKGQPAQEAKAPAPPPRVEILPNEGEPDIISGTKVTEVKVNGETYRVRVPSGMNKGEASIHVKDQLKAQQQPATVAQGTTGLSRTQAQPSPPTLPTTAQPSPVIQSDNADNRTSTGNAGQVGAETISPRNAARAGQPALLGSPSGTDRGTEATDTRREAGGVPRIPETVLRQEGVSGQTSGIPEVQATPQGREAVRQSAEPGTLPVRGIPVQSTRTSGSPQERIQAETRGIDDELAAFDAATRERTNEQNQNRRGFLGVPIASPQPSVRAAANSANEGRRRGNPAGAGTSGMAGDTRTSAEIRDAANSRTFDDINLDAGFEQARGGVNERNQDTLQRNLQPAISAQAPAASVSRGTGEVGNNVGQEQEKVNDEKSQETSSGDQSVNVARESDIYRTKGSSVNEAQLDAIDARAAKRGDVDKGEHGKISAWARKSHPTEKGRTTPLALQPALRRYLGLPPIPQNADNATLAKAAYHTMDALAEKMGKARSSEIDHDAHVDFLAQHGKNLPDEVIDSYAKTLAAYKAQEAFENGTAELPEVKQAIQEIEDAQAKGERQTAKTIREKFSTIAQAYGLPKVAGERFANNYFALKRGVPKDVGGVVSGRSAAETAKGRGAQQTAEPASDNRSADSAERTGTVNESAATQQGGEQVDAEPQPEPVKEPDTAPIRKPESPASLSDTAAREQYDKAVAELRRGKNENGNPFSPSKRKSLEDDVRDMGRKLGLPQTVDSESGAVFTRDEIVVGKERVSRRRRANGTDGEIEVSVSAPPKILSRENWAKIDPDKTDALIFAKIDFASGRQPKKTDASWSVYTKGRKRQLEKGLTYKEAVEFAKDYVASANQSPKSGITFGAIPESKGGTTLGTAGGAFAKFNEADLGTIAKHFVHHGKDYVSWAKAMIKDFGQTVRQQLRAIWDGLKAFTKDERGVLNERRVVELIQKGLEKTGIAEKKKTREDIENSPEFKRWFGDSKVVDENGKPLIVYHGTRFADKVKQFQPSDVGMFGPGIYTTQDPEYANIYAKPARFSGEGTGHATIPVYVAIKNPYTVDYRNQAEWKKAFAQKFDADRIKALKAQGYDGIIMIDASGGMAEINAFSPTQIKSVFNRGTFDPTNPNISAMGFGAFQRFFEKKSPKLEALREKVPIPKEYNFDNLYKALVEVIGDRNLSKKTQAKINEHWDAMIDAYNADDGAALLEHQSELKTLIGSRWWVMADLLRPLNATGEISVVGRQGFIGWATHPILSGKAFKNAAWRSGDYWNWVAKFAASEDRAFAEKAGLDYGLSHEIQFGKQSLGQEENTAVSKIIKNIPLFKQMENFNKTFIDGQRTILFQWGVKQIEKKGQPTVDAKGNPSVHVKEWAKEINRITGRGNIKQGLTKELVNASSVVGYSPRFAISRFQGLNPARIATVTRHSPTVAGMIAKDYAKLAVVTTGFGLMLRALGATINLDDPDDDDFLVAKWGNYRVALLQGGMHAQAKYARRMLKRMREVYNGEAFAKGKGIPRAAQQTGKFLRYKEAPLTRVVHDQVFDRRDVKDFVTGETVNMGHDALGRPTSFAQSLKQSGLPIFYQQLYEAYKDEGLLGMTKLSPEFLGVSANLYNSSREPLSDNDKIQSRGDQIKPRFSYTGGQSDWKAKLGLRSGQENDKAFAVRADTAKQRYQMLESQLMKSRPFQAATPEDKQYLQELLQRKVAEESNTGEAWKPKDGWMPSLIEALKRHKTETKNEAKRDAKRVIPAWQ